MSIKKLIQPRVVTVEMDDTLQHIRDIFDNVPFHHLVVVDGKKAKGMISDRDLFKALSPFIDTASERSKDEFTLQKRAHQIMSRRLITVQEDTSIFEVIDLLCNNKISCLPVVDANQNLKGILSWRDILRAIGNKRPEN